MKEFQGEEPMKPAIRIAVLLSLSGLIAAKADTDIIFGAGRRNVVLKIALLEIKLYP